MAVELIRQASLEHTQNHIHIEFSQPHQIMSSAVLNGGFVIADHHVNMKVPKDSSGKDSPEFIALTCSLSPLSSKTS